MPDTDHLRALAARWRVHALPALATSRAECRCADELEVALALYEAASGARWQALKDYLAESIAADEAVRQGMVADGEDEMAAPFGGLVSANRSTLARMRELEAGK